MLVKLSHIEHMLVTSVAYLGYFKLDFRDNNLVTSIHICHILVFL